MQKHKIFACLLAMCFGAIIFRWKSLKLLLTPLECKHVPLQTLPSVKFRVGQLACRFNWPRPPLLALPQYRTMVQVVWVYSIVALQKKLLICVILLSN